MKVWFGAGDNGSIKLLVIPFRLFHKIAHSQKPWQPFLKSNGKNRDPFLSAPKLKQSFHPLARTYHDRLPPRPPLPFSCPNWPTRCPASGKSDSWRLPQGIPGVCPFSQGNHPLTGTTCGGSFRTWSNPARWAGNPVHHGSARPSHPCRWVLQKGKCRTQKCPRCGQKIRDELFHFRN